MADNPAFARRVFRWAAIYGILALAPGYFLETRIGSSQPPPITHPEYFYGFIGIALAWQVVFLVIARDPVRFRPLMLPAVLEKLAFGGASLVLFALQRIGGPVLAGGLIDLGLAVAFVLAYMKCPEAAQPGRGALPPV